MELGIDVYQVSEAEAQGYRVQELQVLNPPSEGPYSTPTNLTPTIAEREWTMKERKRAKNAGHTLPGTTKFPIENEADLHSAIALNGHGDKAANRKWIKRAAARLGLSNLIPDSWRKTTT
jgi:hypothetical protein